MKIWVVLGKALERLGPLALVAVGCAQVHPALAWTVPGLLLWHRYLLEVKR